MCMTYLNNNSLGSFLFIVASSSQIEILDTWKIPKQTFIEISNNWTFIYCIGRGRHDHMVQYSWQHTLTNAEVLLRVVNHGLMISFITHTCTDGQQLNKQYDPNDFQVDVPDSIGVSKIILSMYVWFVTLVTFYLVEIFT